MAFPPLTPMQKLGSTDPLFYAERDFGAEETPARDVADFQFYNEVCRWQRDAVAGADLQHFLNGVHDYLPIARAKLKVNWNGDTVAPAYTVDARESYVQDTSGGLTEGAGVATCAHAGLGLIQVTLARAMANNNYRALCMTQGFYGYSTFGGILPLKAVVVAMRARCWIYSITSTTVFTIQRKEWTAIDFTSALRAPGNFEVHIFAG